MKLRQKKYIDGAETLDYYDPFVYKDGTLDHVATGAGRAVFTGGSFSYFEYHLKDHLGNVRVAFKKNGSVPQVLQRNDNYPFGMPMGQSGTSTNRYLYNGKEELEAGSINFSWLDYGQDVRWAVGEVACC